jgi:hypothetical protein
VSTIGLNRSTTLYLKPALGIEQSLPGITFALSNVYYDTGSAKIKPSASFGLDKLTGV